MTKNGKNKIIYYFFIISGGYQTISSLLRANFYYSILNLQHFRIKTYIVNIGKCNKIRSYKNHNKTDKINDFTSEAPFQSKIVCFPNLIIGKRNDDLVIKTFFSLF